MIEILLKGLIVGLVVSAPMGPIGVLCVQKTINKGRFQGFVSGLGAATADTSYAVLAAFGVTFITDFLTEHHLFFQIAGVSILLFLGFRMLLKNPIQQYRYYRSPKRSGLIGDYISVFFLTASNPLTIIFFGAALFIHSTRELHIIVTNKLPGLAGGGISVLWSIFAFVLVFNGLRKSNHVLRYLGLALFTVVVFKVFLLDMKRLDAVYRVGAFLAFGILLMCAAFIYLKFWRNKTENTETTSKPQK